MLVNNKQIINLGLSQYLYIPLTGVYWKRAFHKGHVSGQSIDLVTSLKDVYELVSSTKYTLRLGNRVETGNGKLSILFT